MGLLRRDTPLGGFHPVYLDAKGKIMSSYEHRIIVGALKLADANERGDEHAMQHCVIDIIEQARALKVERRAQEPVPPAVELDPPLPIVAREEPEHE
jgi:hypothetical protein